MGYGYNWDQYGGARDDYGYRRGYPSWYRQLYNQLNDNVLVTLTSGGGYSAVSGVLGRVYPGYIVLVSGNVITEIPMNRIAAVSKLAGGGPVPPGKC